MSAVDVVIVGGGILGCATAWRVLRARPGLRVRVVEKERALGLHQTGRNSGVIHSGLYYAPGSLKARNCRDGYARLIEFCRDEGIPYRICGKLVVATSVAEEARLDELHRRGIANGLRGLRRLRADEIQEVEPHCRGTAALLVPETGVVDFGAVAQRYAELAMAAGAEFVFAEEIVDIRAHAGGADVIGRSRHWSAKAVVACAGLYADRLALKTERDLPLRIIPFRGEYYALRASAQHLVKNLIYPVPDPAFPFLGVHFTRRIGGEVECGPNAVLALGREAYRGRDVNLRDAWQALAWPGFHTLTRRYWRAGLAELHRSLSKRAFVRALQKLVPSLASADVVSGGAGIRAQACTRAGALVDDFDIRGSRRVIHVCNAPSPAATASLAIGDVLAARAIEALA